MILNPETGLTSPQFHLKHDDKFETVKIDPLMEGIDKWQRVTRIHVKSAKSKSNESSKTYDLRSNRTANQIPMRTMPSSETVIPRAQRENAVNDLSQRETSSQRETGNQNLAVQGAEQRTAESQTIQNEVNSRSTVHNESQSSENSSLQKKAMSANVIDRMLMKEKCIRRIHTHAAKVCNHEELLTGMANENPFAFASSLTDEDT